MRDLGGDPACFLASTCLACGRFLEPVDLDEGVCPRCGETVDIDGPAAVDPAPADPR